MLAIRDYFFEKKILQPISGLMATALACAPVAGQANVPSSQNSDRQSGNDISSSFSRAVHCLAQTISYEAGNEPLTGQEAVAQVVLNRVRHSAYPSTICGVVYQGAARKTGCQFSFTCDGSLGRARSLESMSRSRAIAIEMLDGKSSRLVGGATHYHAYYVSPYWAPTLIKVKTIGAHIFYRMRGAAKNAAILSAANLAPEPDIAAGLTPASDDLPAPKTKRPAVNAFSPWGLPVLIVGKDGKVRTAE